MCGLGERGAHRNGRQWGPRIARFGQGAGRTRSTGGSSSFASFDGTRIAYSDEGEGPAVILLHGFGMDGLDNYGPFDRLLPKLERTNALLRETFGAAPPLPSPPAEGRPGLAVRLREAGARVIVPDMRGFGASDKPRDTVAYADSAMARDVIALVRHLGLDAVDVLGFSMGSSPLPSCWRSAPRRSGPRSSRGSPSTSSKARWWTSRRITRSLTT